jgi:hypothetical protein
VTPGSARAALHGVAGLLVALGVALAASPAGVLH